MVGQDRGREGREGGREERTLCAVVVAVDVEDPDGALEAHALLGDAHDLRVVVGKADALDGRREFPLEEAFARLHGPKPHRIIRRSRDEEARLCWVRWRGPRKKKKKKKNQRTEGVVRYVSLSMDGWKHTYSRRLSSIPTRCVRCRSRDALHCGRTRR